MSTEVLGHLGYLLTHDTPDVVEVARLLRAIDVEDNGRPLDLLHELVDVVGYDLPAEGLERD